MEDSGQDEVDAAAMCKEELKVAGDLETLVNDEKDLYWMGGVLNCFSTVLSIFRPEDKKLCKDNEWDVPFESISNLIYLGSGAQGVVFSGMFRNEMVAVKKLRDKSETNFKHLWKLKHENLVGFKGVCTQPPSYCVIMEYCHYGPLYDFIHSGVSLNTKQILKWAKEIGQGMAYLHHNNIIHRDLKSPNVLISDNLVVKVSDFGTSREWDHVSAVMSFTGTVAWMAPEIIRHEPCSERVDIWSYGVVLWELITQEAPYKNLESHAIMWGVGIGNISLPIPNSCPEALQVLMKQCWNRTPRSRPPFKIILGHLEIATEAINSVALCNVKSGRVRGTSREEARESISKMFKNSEHPDLATRKRREEIRHVRDIRDIYQQQLNRANELYLEMSAVRLQLEQREKSCAEREKALRFCRCGFKSRRGHKFNHLSSSSDYAMPSLACYNLPKLDNSPEVQRKIYQPKIEKTHQVQRKMKPKPKVEDVMVEKIVAIKADDTRTHGTSDDCADNNNIITVQPKDTVVEFNGNIEVNITCNIAQNEGINSNKLANV